MNHFESLGVVINRTARPVSEIKDLFNKLESAFVKNETTKVEIVKILQDFLSNFGHEEKGKSLDSKM